MRKVFTLTFVCFLGAICAGVTEAQERLIDFSSRGANVFGAPGAQSLSLPSQAAPAVVVATFLRSRGFRPETVASLVVKKAGRVSRTGITHLRFAQEVEGLAVYGTYVKAAVNDDGELVHLIENLATPSSGRLMPTAIGESAALDAALDEVHPGVSVNLLQGPRDGNATRFSGDDFFYRDPTVMRVAIPMASGVLEEGFLVETWTEEANLLHHTLIDGTGRVLRVELRTSNDSYNIFPEHPGIPNSQTVVAGPGITGNAESPDGWLDLEADGVNLSAQSSIEISGNNAHAYLDWDNSGTPDPGGSTVWDGDFLATANLMQQPYTLANQEVAVQNLFYFNNVIHDKLYRHGFDEMAGNFQEQNFTAAGLPADSVNAEAQDSGGVTYNNANFATPLDGSPPRMQMYLWNPGVHTVETTDGSTYAAGGAMFGPTPTGGGRTGDVVIAVDGTAPTSDGCEALTNVAAIAGKIALIDRGLCDFVTKVRNAENAGAFGVIIANNPGDNSTVTMADNGTGGDIAIPSVFIGNSDGTAIKVLLPAAATLKMSQLMRDGDVDSDIIWHEYGHGLTWRMIGGMTSSMSGAIGEGMSDVLAILIHDEDRVGEYSTGDSDGIRSRPYSGYSGYRTYGDFSANLGVHRNGEIYAAAVWRVWELFKGEVPSIPQDDLFDYLIDGMNYTPSGPTMEEMRDGILMSAAGSGDECLIWAGFAELGIGYGAQGTSNSVVTESFAVPASCTGGNSAPAASPDSLTVALSGTQTVLDSGQTSVLANDSDPDGPLALTATLVSGPSRGTLAPNSDGTFSYTHTAGDTVSDSFTYRAYDGADYSGATTVSITVTEAGAEVVIITKASYNSKKDKLTVEATSSTAPGAELMLHVFSGGAEQLPNVPMTFNSKKAKYTASITPSAAPTSVMVTSTAGGEATANFGGGDGSGGDGGGGGGCNGKGNKPGC